MVTNKVNMGKCLLIGLMVVSSTVTGLLGVSASEIDEQIYTTVESKNATQTLTYTVNGYSEDMDVTVDTGIVEVKKVNGDQVTVKVSGGVPVNGELKTKYVEKEEDYGEYSFTKPYYSGNSLDCRPNNEWVIGSYGGSSGYSYSDGEGYTGKLIDQDFDTVKVKSDIDKSVQERGIELPGTCEVNQRIVLDPPEYYVGTGLFKGTVSKDTRTYKYQITFKRKQQTETPVESYSDIELGIAGGEFTLMVRNAREFGDIKLQKQPKKYSTSFDRIFNVADARGTQEGWRVDVHASTFTLVEPEDGFADGTEVYTLPIGTLSLTALEKIERVGSGLGGDPVESYTGDKVIDDGSVTVAKAEAGGGMGEFDLTFGEGSLSMVVDATTARVDPVNYGDEGITPYESTLTWNLVSAP